ncbi:hypothetical protein [Absidia glauca]|uniref:C2H2-type domain-containing protein n=1 Tax=Absidia glauca TaxID=4829 RepID=A0A163K5D3_ABSGL|nr:hypothetical protein [Absidia glauca]
MSPSIIRVRWNDQTHLIPYYQIKRMTFKDLMNQIKSDLKDNPPLSSEPPTEEGQCLVYDDHSLRQAIAMKTAPPDIILSVGRCTNSNQVPVIKPRVLRWSQGRPSSKRKDDPPPIENRPVSPCSFAIRLPGLSSITDPDPYLRLAPLQRPPLQHHFVCDHMTARGHICGQTFRRSYDLSRHQTIHLKNRPFCTCQQCGKKFTRTDALQRHQRVQGHHHPSASKARA